MYNSLHWCVLGAGMEQLCIFQYKKYKMHKLDPETTELELYSTGSKDSLNTSKNQSNMIKNELIR